MTISPWFELPGFFDSLAGGTDCEPGVVATGGNAVTEVGCSDSASAALVIVDFVLDVSAGSGAVFVVHEAVDMHSPTSPMAASAFLPK